MRTKAEDFLDLDVLDVVAGGKTKTLYESPFMRNGLLMIQKDILTVKNGLVKMSVPEIGKYKALQNDAIQGFLSRHGIPTAYIGLMFDNCAEVDRAKMIGAEFVERNSSAPNGSWALRNPGAEFPKGEIVSEMFDKRSVVKIDPEISLIMEEAQAAKNYPNTFHADPYIREQYVRICNAAGREVDEYLWELYDQKRPITAENRLATTVSPYKCKDIATAKKLSRKSFSFLTKGLRLAGEKLGLDVSLIDDKTEYGYVDNNIVLADDLNADAFRMDVIKDGVKQDSSKQTFRDLEASGADEKEIRRVMPDVYARTTEITEALRGINL
jgi:phosphoribosylaminoimidazole-succinocarboxamide synthase